MFDTLDIFRSYEIRGMHYYEPEAELVSRPGIVSGSLDFEKVRSLVARGVFTKFSKIHGLKEAEVAKRFVAYMDSIGSGLEWGILDWRAIASEYRIHLSVLEERAGRASKTALLMDLGLYHGEIDKLSEWWAHHGTKLLRFWREQPNRRHRCDPPVVGVFGKCDIMELVRDTADFLQRPETEWYEVFDLTWAFREGQSLSTIADGTIEDSNLAYDGGVEKTEFGHGPGHMASGIVTGRQDWYIEYAFW